MEHKDTLKPNRQRTTQEQLEYYLNFIKQHPELQAGKNCPLAPRAKRNLWEQLTKDLNSIRGPTRTASQWKVTLTNWKNTVRSRARKTKTEVRMTGGGPQGIRLSRLEQEAVQTFDLAAVEGIQGDMPFGIKKWQDYIKDELPPADSIPSVSATPSVASPLSPPPDTVSSPLSLPQENRIDQLLQIAVTNMESQKIREERILATDMAVIASNTSLQKSLEMVANLFTTFTEAIVNNLSKE